jgi:hypothetical protein
VTTSSPRGTDSALLRNRSSQGAVTSHTRRVILVTGCPRSGTTAVGSNLSLAPGARYLYEPFNAWVGMRAISRWFEVPGANDFSMDKFDACVDAIRRVRLDLKHYDWPQEQGLRRTVKLLIGSRAHIAYLLCRLDWTTETIIWKDPIACFASKAAMDRHAIPVLVPVRPPAAVSASFKRLGWASAVQPILNSLAQIGITFDDLMPRFGRHIGDPAINGAILWHIVYRTLLEWRKTTSLMHFFDLQDSIDRPVEVYQGIYELLGLRWTQRVSYKLRDPYESSSRRKASALPQRAHVARRRLSDVNTYGKTLLTPNELSIIESINTDLWRKVQAACVSKIQAVESVLEVAALSAVG